MASEENSAELVSSNPTPPAAPKSQGYRGLFRSTGLPSCVLDAADLRRLYAELDKSSLEAAKWEFDTFTRPEQLSPAEFEAGKAKELARCGVVVHVQGKNGQQLSGQSLEVLDDDNLPDVVTRVRFDSSFGFQLLYNRQPLDRFELTFDFSEPPSFNAYNPWDQSTPNESKLSVIGPHETWVSGVQGRVMSFITHRRSYRGWLHSPLTFNLANYLIGLPASLWAVYRVDAALAPTVATLPVVIRGAMQVWVFIILAFVFRVLLWLLRWAYPQVELRGSKTWRVRTFATGLVGALLVSFIYDVLRAILR